jgi:mono/diheme cytochrome c family protein
MSLFPFHPRRFSRPARSAWTLAAIAVVLLLLSGCAEAGQMAQQPRFDPLSSTTLFADGSSARPSVPNTVSYSADGSVNSPLNTGLGDNGQPFLGFPMPVTKDLVAQGQARFNIFCVVCHGPNGKADGKVVGFQFPKPPDLTSDDTKQLSNNEIFTTITDGTGKMFPYGYRVKPPDRWAIIAYVRAIQLKNGPVTPQTLTAADLNQIGQNK